MHSAPKTSSSHKILSQSSLEMPGEHQRESVLISGFDKENGEDDSNVSDVAGQKEMQMRAPVKKVE